MIILVLLQFSFFWREWAYEFRIENALAKKIKFSVFMQYQYSRIPLPVMYDITDLSKDWEKFKMLYI